MPSPKGRRELTEEVFAAAIEKSGGHAYLVGGCVRDMLMGRVSRDRDYCVTGLSEEEFCALFPMAERVGRSFPVYLLSIGGNKAEVAFARTERKIGRGYRGFAAHFSPEVTIEEDLFRRDTAINAMAISLIDGRLIDPYGGRKDIELRRIRAVSGHFPEDPVRALRAARQAAELEFAVEWTTTELMAGCGGELAKEPGERIVKELAKALTAKRPSVFFRELRKARLMAICIPEIFSFCEMAPECPRIEYFVRGYSNIPKRGLHTLYGQIWGLRESSGNSKIEDFSSSDFGETKLSVPLCCPECDVFERSMAELDLVSRRSREVATRFAALVHGLGCGYGCGCGCGHNREAKGLEAPASWNGRTVLPAAWLKMARFVVKHHGRAIEINQPAELWDLLAELDRQKLSVAGFGAIVEATAGKAPYYLQRGEELLAAVKARVKGSDAPPGLKGEEVGRWLRRRRAEELGKLLPLPLS